MKIRIERLEIEAPDLIKNYFDREIAGDQAFEEKRLAIMQTAAQLVQQSLSALGFHIESPAEPPKDSEDDEPLVPPPPSEET